MNKADLRKVYLEKRKNLSKEQVQEGSRKITDLLFKNIRFDKVSSVHTFLPIEERNEVNTLLIIDRLREEYPSIKIALPRIHQDKIESFFLTTDSRIEKNQWGIPEPAGGTPCSHEHLDLVLVPLLAFDRFGNRVGYGKGFYDRFLTTCRTQVLKAGLSLFEAEEKIDADPFDIPLDFCITPERFYVF